MITNVDTMACSADRKRKLWSEESMDTAKNGVQNENMTNREASKLYNVPFKILRRRVNGTVGSGCKPGPATVLTTAEEEHLESYLIQMADMGFGLSHETVMCLAFKIVDATQQNQKAGRTWFGGFRRCHPKSSIHSPLPLSYCRTQCANMDIINDFSWCHLSTIESDIQTSMHNYNCDETRVSVVHKPGKVVAKMGQHKVYAVTSAEKGKTHTILTCVSASSIENPHTQQTQR